ncbi:hypothetical protein [Chitinibacter sp. ZOR0017]|uniref:hypothetical protein n=1 Tax=Chitinibacter sp. ZOR0017 TaxID=1339254 RepID=UPI0012E03EA7
MLKWISRAKPSAMPRISRRPTRLYKKAKFAEAKLRHLSHILMENRNGLVADVETTQATGTAEREAAETMAARRL